MEPTTLKEQATQMLQSLIASATQAGDFIKEQMPIVIKELLAFNTAKYAIYSAICAAIVIAYLTFIYKYWKKEYPRDSEDGIAILGGGVSMIAMVAFVIEGAIPLLKITLAPRVWLIEYAASLVK